MIVFKALYLLACGALVLWVFLGLLSFSPFSLGYLLLCLLATSLLLIPVAYLAAPLIGGASFLLALIVATAILIGQKLRKGTARRASTAHGA